MDPLVLRIDSLAAGGDGVARAPDGRVVFVPFTAPGDLVRVAVEQRRPRFSRARVTELLTASASRVEPRCSVFGDCGGCTWQHLDYATQLEAKRDIVAAALARIGGLEVPEVSITPSPSPYGYRLRARLHVEAGRIGYRRRRSNALCPVAACPVLLPALDAELARLAAGPPLEDGEWELACAGARVRSIRLDDARKGTDDELRLPVAEEELRLSPGVFAQANALLLEPLLERVLAAAGSGRLAVELFAGGGLFTLPLGRRFERVVAVESDEAAVSDLRANLAASGLESVRVVARRLEALDGPELGLGGEAPELVLLDPPRTGLPRHGLERVLALGAERIVYLSCDPATLARDLRALCGPASFRLETVEAFDLFPQTSHVEVLATLERA